MNYKKIFSSGDIGDCGYALPILKKVGGGVFVMGNRPFTKAITYFDFLKPFMMSQEYVKDFRMETPGEQFDYDVSTFRPPNQLCTLTQLMAEHVGEWPVDVSSPWLVIPVASQTDRVVIHRSPRYNNDRFPWRQVVEFYGDRLLFVGLPSEHQTFCSNYGQVEFKQVKSFLETAEIIASSYLFIGNQSSPFSIAEGLKHRRIQEVCDWTPDCIFGGQNVQYIYAGFGAFPHPDKDPLLVTPGEKRLRDRMGGCPGGYRFTLGDSEFIAANFNSLMIRIRKYHPEITEDTVDAYLAKDLKPPYVNGVEGNFSRVQKRFREVGYDEDKAFSRFASM